MKFQSRMMRSAICLAQTVLLIAGNGAFAYAATGSTNGSLDNFEKSIFGETHTALSENTRLKDLEMNLFGKARSGSTAARIADISKALGGSKNDNLLLPALAPQMDNSADRPIQSAPASAQNYDSSSHDPVITASGDAEKETLRNAMRLYSQGRTDEAEKQFRKALSINKNSSDAYYNLGVIDEAKGDLQGALSNYRSASRINPADTDLANAISGVETKLQDKVTADQHQKQVQQQAALEQQQQRKTDSLKQMISEAATAYKGGNYDKAISNLQYVSQQAPNDADVLYALGQAYKAKGDFSQARGTLNSAIAIDPGNQLYKNSIADLNRVANSGGSSSSSNYDSSSSSGNSGGPAPAPHRNRNQPSQLTSFTGNDNSGFSNGGSSGSGSVGQLTPFSGGASNSSSSFNDDEYANNTSGGIGPISSMRRSGGIGGLGSMGGLGVGLLGAGALGSMLGGGVRYNGGYSSSYMSGGRYGNGGTRLRRVAIGSLTGAAAGALYGQMGRGGNVRGSAMTGALMGAAMGLFMGGH
jgi:tetratricopeptide (TPR) repeat protein